MIKTFILFFLLSLTACSCSNQDRQLNTALDLAGKNRIELEKVLNHYQNEPEKLSAAQFLIRNMIGKQVLDSNFTKFQQPYFDALANYRKTYGSYKNDIQFVICDSIHQQHPNLQAFPGYQSDLQILSADFLIHHIDEHFRIRNSYTWCKDIPFETFCRYVLPYTTNNCYWTEAFDFFHKRYAAFKKDTVGKHSYEEIAQIIAEEIDSSFLQDWILFVEKYPKLLPTSFQNLVAGQAGTCVEENTYKIAALRANGIPAVLNTVPTWGNSNNPHFWTEIISGQTQHRLYDNTQRPYFSEQDVLVNNMFWKNEHFPFTKDIPSHITLQYCRAVAKVYRVNYEMQPHSLVLSAKEDIPDFFRNPGLEDITNQYMVSQDIQIPLWNNDNKPQYVYLCCYDYSDWKPVCWSIPKSGHATFPQMAVNVLYLPAYYINKEFIPAGEPFILMSNGKIRYLSHSLQKKEAIATFYAKVPFRLNRALQASTTLGTRFYACHRKDLKDTLLIHTIEEMPFYVDSFATPNKPYRYLLCDFSQKTTRISYPYTIAEIKIFDPKGRPIHAQVTGTPGLSDKKLELLTDGDRVSYYQPSQFEKQQYVLFDFGEPRAIGKVEFYPRSDDNRIVSGELYELFYWDGEWISLGKQVAQANQLVYHNIPQNALFRIHNHTRGKEHRPFTYENGKQVWW